MISDANVNILLDEQLGPDWPEIRFAGGNVGHGESFTDAAVRKTLKDCRMVTDFEYLFPVFDSKKLNDFFYYDNHGELTLK